MKQNRQRFWMCWVEGTGMPRVQHWDRNKAIVEAERLARECTVDVFLLEATMFVRTTKPQPPTEWKGTSI